jgi:hypothetical protein
MGRGGGGKAMSKRRYNFMMGWPIFIHGKGTYWLVVKDGKVSIPALEREGGEA